jgi:uncharacterized RDD family membrane protein YckC
VQALQGRPAGLVSRSLADLVDLVLVMAAVLLVYLSVAAVRFFRSPLRFRWPEVSGLVLTAFGFGLLIVYLAAAWSGTGRSAGKQVMGLRVERFDGTRLGFGQAFVRAVLCSAFPVGLALLVFNGRSASLQDLIVRTKVVYDWVPHVSGHPGAQSA